MSTARQGAWRFMKLLGAAAVIAALLSGDATLHGAARIEPCASTEMTASIGGQALPRDQRLDRLSIVLVGDTGFNPAGAGVEAQGVRTKRRQVLPFAETLSGIEGEVDSDLAFVNIETVVTDRNDLVPEGKGQKTPFLFRSHPLSLKALIDTGFNLFSLANNHSFDYGARGIEETLYHLAVANAERPIAYAGIGANFEEATRPGCLEVDGARVGFAAAGIITGQLPEHRAGDNEPGQASYRHRPDFEVTVNRLAGMTADYRILSIHYGLEGRVMPDERQLADWRGFAAQEQGIDLIVGHHPHVVQGVELNGKSLIFYGLGNFVHPGTADMSRFGLCQDYGLMAKVHLARIEGTWTVAAVEAIPLTKTHVRPERFPSPQESTTRILALNHLAAQLDDGKTAKGVRFTPRPDGSGLYCAAGADALGGKVEALCADWQPAAMPPPQLASRVAIACQDRPFYGRRPATKRQKAPQLFPFGGRF